MRWWRHPWFRTLVVAFLVSLAASVAVVLGGGWLDPFYAVGLSVAVAALAAGVRVAAERIDPWAWPESATAVPRSRRVGVDDRALHLQNRLLRDDPADRADAIRPAVLEVVVDRLRRRHGVAPDEVVQRAEEWLSPTLAGFLTEARTSLTLDEFDALMKEIETL